SDTYILNLMGAFEFNHFAIRPQSGWFFVSHALAHSTGPKGINKKVALIRQSTQLDSTTPSEHLLYGLIELTHYLPHFSM
ncbi:hypothetical protein, partial [Lactiplantibacillus plantarum]|uniref:hypothetical protein n=1 Tax=Lactiplantibacillus plantarum TaxID=1590 RepID=UPI001C9E66D2